MTSINPIEYRIANHAYHIGTMEKSQDRVQNILKKQSLNLELVQAISSGNVDKVQSLLKEMETL